MQLYDGAITQIEGGTDWDDADRVYRLLLLSRTGLLAFDPTDVSVTETLASTSTEYTAGGYGRIPLHHEGRDFPPFQRNLRFRTETDVPYPALRSGDVGGAVLYEFVTDDDASVPLAYLSPAELVLLMSGEGYVLSWPSFNELTELRAAHNAQRTYLSDGVLQDGTLAIDATPEKFKTTTTLIWRRNGIQFSKAAATAIAFSAAHPVTAAKFGIVLVQVDDAGTVTTKIPGATQTTTMAYNSAALALAALPAVDAGNTAIGYIAIEAGVGAWTAITDDLTDASDLTTAAFVDATVVTLPAAV